MNTSTFYYIYLGVLYISIIILIKRANYPLIQALIPGYNIIVFAKLLRINIFFVIGCVALMVMLPEARIFILTMAYIFLPYMISYKYDSGFIYGTLMLVCPYLIMPLFALMKANYVDTSQGLR